MSHICKKLFRMRNVLEIALVYNDKKLREIIEGMVNKIDEYFNIENKPEIEKLLEKINKNSTKNDYFS